MARNKTSNFSADEGLFDNLKSTQQVQEVNTISISSTSSLHNKFTQQPKEIGTTQGKKGQKLKRINMAFSDINHEYIVRESRKIGISATAFVNQIIDLYRTQN